MLGLSKPAIVFGLKQLNIGFREESDRKLLEKPIPSRPMLLQHIVGPGWIPYVMVIFAAMFTVIAILRRPR